MVYIDPLTPAIPGEGHTLPERPKWKTLRATEKTQIRKAAKHNATKSTFLSEEFNDVRLMVWKILEKTPLNAVNWDKSEYGSFSHEYDEDLIDGWDSDDDWDDNYATTGDESKKSKIPKKKPMTLQQSSSSTKTSQTPAKHSV